MSPLLEDELIEIDLRLDTDLLLALEEIASEQNKTVEELCEFLLQEAFKPNSDFWNHAYVKPCPFCGVQPDIANADTLYPNGSAWLATDGITHFVDRNQAPPENWCYSIHCVETAGGCGAKMSGNSKQDATEKWNRRP